MGRHNQAVIRVVAWNIEHGRNIKTAIDEITSTPELAGADIVLVQEMSPDSAAELASGLGMDHYYGAVANSCVTGLPFGNAVLSPWPMGEGTTVALPGVAPISPQPRCAVHVRVEIDGEKISAISAHLETAYMRRRGRTEQAQVIARHPLANRPEPTVIGGDFNSASPLAVRAIDRVMTGAAFSRATDATEPTFRRFGRSFTLDHLFARGTNGRRWQPVESGVVQTAQASDHQPIWTELSFD